MASASYSLPQKILDEMIVDEGPEGRDICGDGTVLFHRTKRRDASSEATDSMPVHAMLNFLQV